MLTSWIIANVIQREVYVLVSACASVCNCVCVIAHMSACMRAYQCVLVLSASRPLSAGVCCELFLTVANIISTCLATCLLNGSAKRYETAIGNISRK